MLQSITLLFVQEFVETENKYQMSIVMTVILMELVAKLIVQEMLLDIHVLEEVQYQLVFAKRLVAITF